MRTSPSDLDHLFQLPLGEFTAARNALASKLKKAGRAEEAEKVKRLLKPPASAWTVNQLYWRHGKELSALMDNGDRFRAAHNEWARIAVTGNAHLTGDMFAPKAEGRLKLVDTDLFADPVGKTTG